MASSTLPPPLVLLVSVISSLLLLRIFPCGQSVSTLGVGSISRILEIQDRERAPASLQVAAARGVLRRLLPSHSSSFEFRIVSKEQCGGASCFIISNHPYSPRHGSPEIVISGLTGVEMVAGLHWYLKYWCGAHISWGKTGGAQLNSVPESGYLPRVEDDGVFIQRPVPWNYYQNAVSSSCRFFTLMML
ncbi:NAGLU [Linum perenne]